MQNILPWIWLGVVALCTIVELATMGLTTIWFGLGAVLMVFVSFLTPLSLPYQVLLFLIISAILLFFTRPIALKKMNLWQEKTNLDSLIGKVCLVTKAITSFEKGEVKIDGKLWTAKSIDDSEILSGQECVVEKIEGVTAIVKK